MNETNPVDNGYQAHIMTDKVFNSFAKLIYDECGIYLSPAKKSMVTVRLSKRLRALGMGSFGDYYEFVNTSKGQEEELVPMIDVITTNTTHFFRERNHFSYLVDTVVPNLINSGALGKANHLNIWSAGCSTGEEPYTLAMVLADYFERNEGSFSIFATDISVRVLQKARQAVYDEEAIRPVPVTLKHKYLMRGTGAQKGRYRVVPELRSRINFSRLNFIEDEFDNLLNPIHIIFCRNVIIYFDMQTKIELIRKFHKHLAPGGYYFIGHSESLNSLSDGFSLVAPTVYRKLG